VHYRVDNLHIHMCITCCYSGFAGKLFSLGGGALNR
jgi:hypothetical protein